MGIGNVKGDSTPLALGGGLAAHEAKGRHLIDRHIGKTDEELLQRLQINKKIRTLSQTVPKKFFRLYLWIENRAKLEAVLK